MLHEDGVAEKYSTLRRWFFASQDAILILQGGIEI